MIRTKSPTSLKIAFREVREGKMLSFDDCMRMEFRIASRILAGHDFFEGVRAALVEKDNAPRWRPSSLGEVTDDAVGAYFAPLGEKELPV
jgi:enoyl-CoA hydratase